MRLLVIVIALASVNFSLAQSYSIAKVQENLVRSSWQLTMFNETGRSAKGSGYCDFKIVYPRKGTKNERILLFYLRSSHANEGEWSLSQVEPGVFKLTLKFKDPRTSPIVPLAPVDFKIVHPYKPEDMRLELIPPPNTRNQIVLKKH